MGALEVQMTGAVTDIDPARPWAVAVVVVIHPLRMMIITIAAVLLEDTALAAMTTADALRRASFMTGVKEDMDVHRLVVAWRSMSMAHRVRATLKILTMPGPDLLLVATTILI